MLEWWDEGSSCFHLIKALTRLRKENRAIQWGGLWPKIVERDLYVFVRKYHESRAVVIINKGAERMIEELDTELPSGTYSCALTGETVEITDGKTKGVKVGAGQARIFSFAGPKIAGKSVVLMQLNGISTQPGDQLVVTGDCPELGAWDLAKAVRLEYVNSNTWFGEIAFNETAGKPTAYKLALLHSSADSAPLRENRVVRRRPIALEGITKWQDVWER